MDPWNGTLFCSKPAPEDQRTLGNRVGLSKWGRYWESAEITPTYPPLEVLALLAGKLIHVERGNFLWIGLHPTASYSVSRAFMRSFQKVQKGSRKIALFHEFFLRSNTFLKQQAWSYHISSVDIQYGHVNISVMTTVCLTSTDWQMQLQSVPWTHLYDSKKGRPAGRVLSSCLQWKSRLGFLITVLYLCHKWLLCDKLVYSI